MNQEFIMAAAKRIALITGATRGIGLETARQLGKLGFVILVGSRDAVSGDLAVTKLKSESIDAKRVQLDVCEIGQTYVAARWIDETFGKLDVLINNAGVGYDFAVPTTATPLDIWRSTFDANLFGVVSITHALLPLLRKSDAGRIVNLSSILGSHAFIAEGNGGAGAAYGSSKAALNMYTQHLAQELQDTLIKVNAAHPGWVQTDMGGKNAPMDIEAGARTSVRLATLDVNGPSGGYFHLDTSLAW
jgi:NAD(P)-dependent dehydrogenase (short-subunit alcohol dehydrogenase family)